MIFETVRAIVAQQFSEPEESITMETSFVEDLKADSLDLVEVAYELEENFAIPEIDNDELVKLQTVGDVVEYIARVTE